jgi:hypothetical protein
MLRLLNWRTRLPPMSWLSAPDLPDYLPRFTCATRGVDVGRAGGHGARLGRIRRNNGQVIPTLSRADPESLVKLHGAAGERFVGLIRDSASIL